MELITKKIKLGNRDYLFEIISADNFTVTPPMKNRELAESTVWGIITQPGQCGYRAKTRATRRGGVRG